MCGAWLGLGGGGTPPVSTNTTKKKMKAQTGIVQSQLHFDVCVNDMESRRIQQSKTPKTFKVPGTV